MVGCKYKCARECMCKCACACLCLVVRRKCLCVQVSCMQCVRACEPACGRCVYMYVF